MVSRETVVVLLVILLGFAAGPLLATLDDRGPDYRGGTVRACVLDTAPENATVVPAANETVQATPPVLRAVENATRGDDSQGFTTYSPAEQPAVETFVDSVPDGPYPDDTPCYGGHYVRYRDAVVQVGVTFNAGDPHRPRRER